jgi:hypothetical protein
MIECLNTNFEGDNLDDLNENAKIKTFDFSKRKLCIGQWVDVKDTIDQWLEAQVIDVKENKVYIHYNGWGTRWDEWIDMDSDRIMPFRYHTKQKSFSNYNCPFPNVKPDANVNIYNTNDNTENQFYDIFSDISNSFDNCNTLFKKIKENREYLILNEIKEDENENNYDFFNKYNENINDIKMHDEENKIQEEIKNKRINNINYKEKHKEKEKENSAIRKIKQREIFIYSKQISPLLDRLGRIMTDTGSFIYHNMKNYKLEE